MGRFEHNFFDRASEMEKLSEIGAHKKAQQKPKVQQQPFWDGESGFDLASVRQRHHQPMGSIKELDEIVKKQQP